MHRKVKISYIRMRTSLRIKETIQAKDNFWPNKTKIPYFLIETKLAIVRNLGISIEDEEQYSYKYHKHHHFFFLKTNFIWVDDFVLTCS